jgi:hypothetical protein
MKGVAVKAEVMKHLKNELAWRIVELSTKPLPDGLSAEKIAQSHTLPELRKKLDQLWIERSNTVKQIAKIPCPGGWYMWVLDTDLKVRLYLIGVVNSEPLFLGEFNKSSEAYEYLANEERNGGN